MAFKINTMKQIAKLQFITQDVEGFSHLQQIEEAIKGGCQWVQLRVKDRTYEEILEIACIAREITRKANIALIINDSPEIAKAVNANGVHLGKNDCSPTAARTMLGPDFIIGATANTFDDIQDRIRQPIDYLGVGPYKFTSTKKNLSPVLGIEGYQKLVEQCRAANIKIPMVAIGSVHLEDVEILIQAGMYGVAVSSAISKDQNPAESTKQLLNEIKNQLTVV